MLFKSGQGMAQSWQRISCNSRPGASVLSCSAGSNPPCHKMSATIPHELLPPEAKGLVFDCDGTLCDTMGLHCESWQHTCDLFGLQFSPQIIVELAGKPMHEIFDIVTTRSGKFGQVDQAEFFRIKNEFFESNYKPAPLIEPVMEIFRAGKALGLPCAVASGGTRHHVERELREADILHLFDAVVCGEDVQRGKPAPDAFLLAASKLGVEPQLCVGYEDAKMGMEAIKAAGYLAAVDVTVLPGYPHLC